MGFRELRLDRTREEDMVKTAYAVSPSKNVLISGICDSCYRGKSHGLTTMPVSGNFFGQWRAFNTELKIKQPIFISPKPDRMGKPYAIIKTGIEENGREIWLRVFLNGSIEGALKYAVEQINKALEMERELTIIVHVKATKKDGILLYSTTISEHTFELHVSHETRKVLLENDNKRKLRGEDPSQPPAFKTAYSLLHNF